MRTAWRKVRVCECQGLGQLDSRGDTRGWDWRTFCNSKRPSYLTPSPDSQRAPGSGQHSDSHGESSADLDEEDMSPVKAQCPSQVLAPEVGGSLRDISTAPTDT